MPASHVILARSTISWALIASEWARQCCEQQVAGGESWSNICLMTDLQRRVADARQQALGQGWGYQVDKVPFLPSRGSEAGERRQAPTWGVICEGGSRSSDDFAHVLAGHTLPGPLLAASPLLPDAPTWQDPRPCPPPPPSLFHLQPAPPPPRSTRDSRSGPAAQARRPSVASALPPLAPGGQGSLPWASLSRGRTPPRSPLCRHRPFRPPALLTSSWSLDPVNPQSEP